jgi:hypothetical protein
MRPLTVGGMVGTRSRTGMSVHVPHRYGAGTTATDNASATVFNTLQSLSCEG